MSKRRHLDNTNFNATLLEEALRLLDEVLKKGETNKAGEVKDLWGIKGSHMIYNCSLRTLEKV